MNFEIAGRAVSLFLEGKKSGARIRFFGGEPILNFPVIVKTIEFAKKRQKGIVFDLTTNGRLLSGKILEKIKKQSGLELILSSGSGRAIEPALLKKISRLPDVSVNLNLWPGDLKKAPETLEFFIASGFERFNFLPAFYIKWNGRQLAELKKCFDSLAEIIKETKGIQVKNLAVNSPWPLFNAALTVDCNGDVYAGNFFLDKRMEFLKNEMRLGNISGMNSLKSAEMPFELNFKKLLEMSFEEDTLESTARADRELTRFCRKIK